VSESKTIDFIYFHFLFHFYFIFGLRVSIILHIIVTNCHTMGHGVTLWSQVTSMVTQSYITQKDIEDSRTIILFHILMICNMLD